MNIAPDAFGGYITITDPSVPDMKAACELIEQDIHRTMDANQDMDPGSVRTWFQAAKDFVDGCFTIRLYWSARRKEVER